MFRILNRGSLRYRALFLLGALLTSFVVACGGGGSGASSSSSSPTPSNGAAAASADVDTSAAAAGKTLANQVGCSACHSVNGGSGAGPTWKGLFGSEVTLTNGSKVTADEAYLKESILDPNAKVAKGFAAGTMPPTFKDSLSAAQVTQLIEYIKSLK